jgi:type IV secretion system protein VirB9
MKILILFIPLLLLACASNQLPPINVTFPTWEEVQARQSPPPSIVDVEVHIFDIPGETPPANSGRSDTQLVIEAQNQYRVTTQRATFFGGAVIYNFIPNHVFQLFTKPLAVSDIALEPGERLTSPIVAGDTHNFIVGTGVSFENGVERIHVYVKPIYAGKRTTLTINTDRRVYRFDVRSFQHTSMTVVTFNYPLDEMRQMTTRQAQVNLPHDPSRLNFNYRIVPMSRNQPAWTPTIVFNDGERTFINFASAERAAFAPVLFEIRGRERILLNYRVSGTFYIVDSVPEHMELVLSANASNTVSIFFESGGR